MEEIWKPYPGFETYWFSSHGRVERRKGGKSRGLVGTLCGQFGYRAIQMFSQDGKKCRVYTHRAICELFNGKAPEGKNICRHLDTDKDNNAAWNLAWGTALDNAHDGIRAGKHTRGERNALSKLTEEKVQELRKVRKEQGLPFWRLAQTFGVSTMTAYRAAVGKSWK